MFKLNLKIALRNLQKNKAYSLINVLGLALGLSGFTFILLYINYEKSYDRWDAKLENVYQAQELDTWALKDKQVKWMDVLDLRAALMMKNSMDQIEGISRINRLEPRAVILENRVPFLQEGIVNSDAHFFEIFPFHFIYGNAETALSDPNSIVIKEELSKKYFGNINPVGKTIQINQQNWTKSELFTITGVVKELETPSSVNFEIIQFKTQRDMVHDNFVSFSETYLKIKPGQSLGILNQTAQSLYFPLKSALFKRIKMNMADYTFKGLKPSVRFQPLQELHQKPLNGESWFNLVKPIILLSALLLMISIINFVNMFTAQAISRAKEVGVKKVIGANRKAIIFQFLLETTLLCIVALLLGIVLLEVFLPYLNELFKLSLKLNINLNNLVVLIELLGLLILVVLLAGAYPAFFLSSYKPHLVLKGSFVNSHKGKALRSILVGFQFVIAIGFFIGIVVISKQVSFMENRDPGFSSKSVICINSHFDKKIANQIKSIDGVEYLGSNGGIISRNLKLSGLYKFKDETKELTTVLVDLDGLQALGVKLVMGRLFEKKYIQDTVGTVIINESLAKSYGGNMVGKYLFVNDSIPVQVVGVIKDIQVSGFENLIQPTVYTAALNNATGYPNKGLNYVIKFDANKKKTVIAAIDNIWKKEFPSFPLTYTLLRDDLDRVLVAHNRFKKMVEVFSLLAISLSLIGLFALASFLTKQRTKEIAIRKILGATNQTIFIILNKGYLWLIIIANLISWPLIYIALNYWLNGFAYRIQIAYVPFALAFVVSVIATVLTVSLQAKNAVMESPVKALKYE